MVYRGTNKTEIIWVGTDCNLEEEHCIELIRSDDENVFYVTACCNEDWIWAFYMDGVSNYEMVKHTIIDEVFECCTMGELLDALDEIFVTIFEDILVEDDCCCDGSCCESCNHRECLN